MFPPLWKAERKKEREGEKSGGETDRKRTIGRGSQRDRDRRGRNKENESSSQSITPSLLPTSPPWMCLGVLIHSGATSWPPPSCYLWWEGTVSLPAASPHWHSATFLYTSLLWWNWACELVKAREVPIVLWFSNSPSGNSPSPQNSHRLNLSFVSYCKGRSKKINPTI